MPFSRYTYITSSNPPTIQLLVQFSLLSVIERRQPQPQRPFSSSSPLHFPRQASDAIVGFLDSAETQAVFNFLSPQDLSVTKGGPLSPKFKDATRIQKERAPAIRARAPNAGETFWSPGCRSWRSIARAALLRSTEYKPKAEVTFVARPF